MQEIERLICQLEIDELTVYLDHAVRNPLISRKRFTRAMARYQSLMLALKSHYTLVRRERGEA